MNKKTFKCQTKLAAAALALAFFSALQLSAETDVTKYTLDSGEEFSMVNIPEKSYMIGQTEVTQAVYTAIMEDNPSTFAAEEGEEALYPVDTLNWFDSIVFCNRLSLALNLTPAYSVNGSTNPDDWNYEPHAAARLEGTVEWDTSAEGFRLATEEEWEYAAKANLDTKYAGSNNLKAVAWYRKNADFLPHQVATKQPNAWNLYDMAGNVWEWVWDKKKENRPYRVYKGGSCDSDPKLCQIKYRGFHYPMRNAQCYSYLTFGLRIARNK